MEFIKHALTGVDNNTYDIARIVLLIGILVLCFNVTWVCVLTNAFDVQSYGIGFGALCAGVGGLLKLKENTEPKIA